MVWLGAMWQFGPMWQTCMVLCGSCVLKKICPETRAKAQQAWNGILFRKTHGHDALSGVSQQVCLCSPTSCSPTSSCVYPGLWERMMVTASSLIFREVPQHILKFVVQMTLFWLLLLTGCCLRAVTHLPFWLTQVKSVEFQSSNLQVPLVFCCYCCSYCLFCFVFIID